MLFVVVRCASLLFDAVVCWHWCCSLLRAVVVVVVRRCRMLCVVVTLACRVLVRVCRCLALIVACRYVLLLAGVVWRRSLLLLPEVAVVVYCCGCVLLLPFSVIGCMSYFVVRVAQCSLQLCWLCCCLLFVFVLCWLMLIVVGVGC